jgi:hypothetical protein
MIVASIGWTGAGLMLLALALSVYSNGRRSPQLLSVLNLIGGACLVVSTVASRSWPSAFTNVVWCGIAAGGLIAGWQRSRRAQDGLVRKSTQ